MSDALELIYYMLDRFLTTLFSLYFFDGVSVGMIFVTAFIFTILLKYVIAIPRIKVGVSYDQTGHSQQGHSQQGHSQKSHN